MAPFFGSREEFAEVKVNGAGAAGGTGGSHSSPPIRPSGPSCLGTSTGWKAKGEIPVSPDHPSTTFPWIVFQVTVLALCGSWLLSGMYDLMMGGWHDASHTRARCGGDAPVVRCLVEVGLC